MAAEQVKEHGINEKALGKQWGSPKLHWGVFLCRKGQRRNPSSVFSTCPAG
jgi:hypothetical protein